MSRPGPLARSWFAGTALAVVVALVVQIPITAADTGVDGPFDTPAARVVNLFTFFTIQANLLVALTCGLLAAGRTGSSTLFRTLRLDAVLAVSVAGIVYHAVLARLDSFSGAEWFANQLFHTVVPVLTVLGWVLFGPRGLTGGRIVAWSLAFPLAWLAFALVRGALIGWYPYPFVDVIALGYLQVTLNCLLVTVLFLALAAGLTALDRVLGRARRAAPVGP